MKKLTEPVRREELPQAIDNLTEEHQLYVLGVVEALSYAQSTQGKAEPKPIGSVNSGMEKHTD
jgi:hypothetical protein